MFSSIAGRSVLVTGGTRGIGRGIAQVFALAGANVLITGRSVEPGLACARELTALGGGRVGFVPADVAGLAGNRAAVAAAVEQHGGLDVLCANAGVFPQRPLAELTEDDVEQVLAINVKGTVFAVQAAIEPLTASGRGRVILTSSITGPITGNPGFSHYAASKAAQLGFMRTAAIELAPRRITVNAVLPGNIVTEGLAELGAGYRAAMEAAIPMRQLGEVEDIGHAALFFATDQAAYITGQTLVVDGGQVLPESPAAMSAG